MAAVNWLCLVLSFAFINPYVCIKVEPNGIPNDNLSSNNNSLNSETILSSQYTKSTITASNESEDNATLWGDSVLSASERTRRLIPYMAFYLPVSELPINKQYTSKNINGNVMQQQATKQQLVRPSATGPSGSHIPIPPQYVHSNAQYPSSQPSPVSLSPSSPSAASSGQQHYHPNAGLGFYHTYHGYGGQQQQQQLPQQQFHLLPPSPGHSSLAHLQPPGHGAADLSLKAGPSIKANGNNNHNAFVSFKEVNPIRQKTVQHFPPLSSTASTASASSSSDSSYETIRQTSSVIKQKQQKVPQYHGGGIGGSIGSGGGGGGISGNGAVGIYRPRTKQSKINLTPFTPSNIVPGNFVPIVYTPVNSNDNNNNIYNSHNSGAGDIHDSSYNSQDDNQQYHKQQLVQQQQLHRHPSHQQPQQQIAIEYSSAPLPPPPPPPSASAASIPIDVQRQQPQLLHHQQYQQPLQHTSNNLHHNPKQQSQQYYGETTSPIVNVDIAHDAPVTGGVGSGSASAPGDSLNSAHLHHHHHPHGGAQAISPPPTNIYHQNQPVHQQQQQQQQQPEHVIIDASQQPQMVQVIGSQQHHHHQHQQQQQQQHQQQQLYHGGGKSSPSALQFQPSKPESFFESEIQQQQQQHNIDQVLKDVNSYSIKNSQVMTPQEKYVMYLQQRMRYNKHQQQQQQRQHATRHKYREPISNNEDKEQQQFIKQQDQQNPTQIFILSTNSPPSHASSGTDNALAPIRPSQAPYATYSQHSPIHHDLYPRPLMKPFANGEVRISSATGGDEGAEEQVLTIPLHSLFGDMETLQQQQPQHNHYSQSHTKLQSSSPHKSQYSKNRPHHKPQYIDYLIDEPKQSLDDDQQHQQQPHHNHQNPPQQVELLKPTLGPPSHAFILVTTSAPYLNDPVTQENYGSSLRPPYKTKPKIRLQPVLKEKNVNYPTIREQSPTTRPHVVEITPTPKPYVSPAFNEEDEMPKYVYVKEEFGQKLATTQTGGGGAVKLKPSHKYESDNNQIPQQQQQQQLEQEQEHEHEDNVSLHPLTTRQPTIQQEANAVHPLNEVQTSTNVAVDETADIESTPTKTILADPNELPDIRTSSLAEILHKLQESNHLPHTLTPDNIDNSIKTLIRILNNLKQTQTIVANPPQHHEIPAHTNPSSPDYDYTTGSEEDHQQQQQHHQEQKHEKQPPQSSAPAAHDLSHLTPTGPNKHPGPSTGRPGIDYPNYAEIPQTAFDCSEQRYKGFFGDPETNCQVWHYCDLNGGKASFLCPNGTIFSQIALTCDWWFNVKCATTPQLYVLNERLYKYILPFTPKFPEDYSGPIVDKYLAMKFQEMEDKMRLEKEKALQIESEAATENEEEVEAVSEDSKEENHLEETTTEIIIKPQPPAKDHKHESVNSQVSEQSSERNLLIDDEVDDISQRGTKDNFESTTIATMIATKSNPSSFGLKPIIVSSTFGPDYDEEQLQYHENEKRSHLKLREDKTELEEGDKEAGESTEKSVLSASSTESSLSNKMQITVEKVNVIEIKPDGATGHSIRDMLLNSKQLK